LINFLQIYFIFARIFARFCKFQKLSQKERAKESAKRREPTLTKVSFFKTVAIDTPGGNLSLKIKSRAQQITLNPNLSYRFVFYNTTSSEQSK
jgi:hypothetical protein